MNDQNMEVWVELISTTFKKINIILTPLHFNKDFKVNSKLDRLFCSF